MAERPNLKDHSIESLRGCLARQGIAPYRAEQIAGWLYRRGVDDPSRMTDLGLEASTPRAACSASVARSRQAIESRTAISTARAKTTMAGPTSRRRRSRR